MGAGQSKAKQQLDVSINHPKFSNAKFVTAGNKRNIQIAMGVDEKDYKAWKDALEKQKPDQTYLLLPVKEDFSTKGLCGSSGTLNLQFQNFPYLLTEEIYHRKGRKNQFEEQELWYLLYALCNAKNDIRPEDSKVGDIRPNNIFINDNGQVKLENLLSWPKGQTNYALSFEGQSTYVAPEQLKALELGKLEATNSSNSEVFSMGLTLLSSIALEDFSGLYDFKNFRFNRKQLDEKLNDLKVNRAYSDIFKATVSNMLSSEQSQRVSHQELWNWIKPHEKSILARENFIFTQAPQTVDVEFQLIRKVMSSVLVQGAPFVPPPMLQGPPRSSLENIVPSHSPYQSNLIQRSNGEQVSTFSGQKLNFPPPIIRTTYMNESTSPAQNMNINHAQSVYVPQVSGRSDGHIKSADEKKDQNSGNEGSPTK